MISNSLGIDYSSWNKALINIKEKAKLYQYIILENGIATVLAYEASHLKAIDKYKFDTISSEITEVAFFADERFTS